LFATLSVNAQRENDNRGADRFAATVSEIQGVCQVKDKGDTKSRRLKLGDGLKADQEVQCDPKAILRIRFRNNGVEKQISPASKQTGSLELAWHRIPNVTGTLPKEDGPTAPGGRRKGDDLPTKATTPVPSTRPQNVSATERERARQRGRTADPDVADLYWKKKQKYFLIVAAGKTAGVSNNLAFTRVDAQRVSSALTAAGYEKLEVLEDEQATRENFISALGKISSKPKTSQVIIYYSGHASTDLNKTDLWLQLYGQRQFGSYQGLSLSDIVKAARDGAYAGDLSIILDSCYSGGGAETTELSLKEAKDTTIFASSADYQSSYSMPLPNGGEMSAFTYFMIQGLGPAWDEVDGDHDGMMFYSELQAYIGTKLLEKMRDRGVPRIMEPQLFRQPSRSWLAYDARHALNLNSQARNQLRLRLSLEVQDPEATLKQLDQTIPANADAYARALHAIKAERFDEAERLLETAETEDRVSDAVVFWARAIVKERTEDSLGARIWYEKALAATSITNIELMFAAAFANANVGNLIRCKDLLNGILAASAEGGDSNEAVLGSLIMMTIFDYLEGNQPQAELYIRRLQAVGARVLDDKLGEDSNQIVDILADMVANKRVSATRRLEALRSSLSTKESSEQSDWKKLDEMFNLFLGLTEKKTAPATLPKDKLRDWSRFLNNHDSNSLVSLLQELRTSASESTAVSDLLRSPEVNALLVQTVDFARRHKSEKQKTTLTTAKGPVEIEIPGSERESTLESASLLEAAGDIYVLRAERKDVPDAEKLYKQVMSLADQEKLGPKVAFDALFKLASLYENAGRFIDTEALYTDCLAKLNESLGEQNLYTYALYKRLGDLYANWNRPEDAERWYRSLLRLSQSQPIGMWDTLSRETLAQFLVDHDRYEEAAALFEEVIARYEPRQKSAPWLVGESLWQDYFQLGKSYYKLGRFDVAERSLRKSFATQSSAEDPDSNWQSTILVWQWFTADSLKKHEEAARFYRELIRLVETDLAKPHPNELLGDNLRNLARSFRAIKEFSKADELLHLALALQKKTHGDESIETGRVWEGLGNLDLARGQYRNAIASFKIAQTIYEKSSSPALADLSYVLYRTGVANYSQLEFEQARLQLLRATTLLDQHLEAADPDNYSRHQLAIVERKLGHLEAARKVLQPFLDEAQPADPSRTLFALLELTTISRLQGDTQGANRWWARAQSASEKIDPEELQNDWSNFHYQKAMMALVNGRTGDALHLMAVAIAKGENDTEADQPLFLEYLDDYALILRKQGKEKEAVLVEQRAKEIRDRILREK
jgi:hypothetical protein